ncbi:putative dynein light chain protein [Patellaria atrata CBS 101060]|uniref:Dynein light chain protein n=1 Tax=Patellaria atrata CBS 101060 TaxID=1346257 RepID=A0A9P4SDU6_9PEZI|nr:putative dynein light chain protein [Patellaria atrata CBS 101060]
MGNPPVPESKLKEIASEACDEVFKNVEEYHHTNTGDWNSAIINKILQILIGPPSEIPPLHKFAVNSTIIQNLALIPGSDKPVRRGMHAASGAYWDNNNDGMWNYKWEGGETRGMDVVISVLWIYVGPPREDPTEAEA